jgi:hypothetical protein
MQQPHAARLFKTCPTAFGFICGHVLHRRIASVSLDNSVLHNQDPLCRLAVNPDWLNDSLFQRAGLGKSGRTKDY